MLLLLSRDLFTDSSTIGTLSVDGVLQCQTLEDTDRHLEAGGTKIYGQTAIPRGTYEVIVDWSPRFQKNMPHVLDVPQFEEIRIHPGNAPEDTEGCILVGLRRGVDFIYQSVVAFSLLLPKIEAALDAGDTVTLEVA